MDLLSRAIGKMFAGIAEAIRALGVRSTGELVWLCRTPAMQAVKCDNPPQGTFWPSEWQAVLWWYGIFALLSLTPALVQAVVTIYGLRVAVSPGNAKTRSDLYSTLYGLVGMAVLVISAPFLVRLLLELNVALVEYMAQVAAKRGTPVDVFGNLWNLLQVSEAGKLAGTGVPASALPNNVAAVTSGTRLPDAITKNQLVLGVMQLVVVGVELVLNFLYLIRKIVIATSLVMLPIAAWVLVFRASATPLLLLVSEIVSNSFMQFSHAVTIVVLTEILFRDPSRYQWWVLVFAPTLLPVVSSFIRRLANGFLNFLGVNEEKWAGWAALGVGSLVALGKAGTGILGAAGAAGAAKAAGAVARAAGLGGGGGVAGPVAVPLSTLLGGGGGGLAGSGGGLAGTVARTASSVLAGGTGGTVNIPLNTGSGSLLGGSAVERTVRGVLTPGAPQWVTGMQTPGSILQVGESPPPVAQVRDTPMSLSQSGLWLPASVAAQQAQQGGQAAGAAGSGQRGSVATDVLAAVGRSGIRGAEIAFKGSAVVASALVGAGLAAYGGPGAAVSAIEAGRQLADAAWAAPQRVVMTARDIYQRIRERREAASGASQGSQGSGLVVAGRMPAPVVRAGAVGPAAVRV